MSETKRNVPKLRFPGFTEDWEQRKLGEILKVNSGKDYKHLDSGDIPVYGTGGYMLSVSEALSKVDAIGIGRKGTIDKPQYLKAPFWTVDTLFYLVSLEGYSCSFLYHLSNLIPWKKFDESTGVPSLSKSTIDSIQVNIPNDKKEQDTISILFDRINNLITLHQRKLENLELKKKALLQKLFPKNGEQFPELRFPGFTDAWEQRKFMMLLKKLIDYRGKTPKKLGESWSKDGHLALSAINVKMGYIDKTVETYYGDDKLYNKWMQGNHLYKGQVLMTMEAPMGNIAQIPDNEKYILSQRTIALVPTEEIIDDFLATLLKGSKFQSELLNKASGGTAKGVSQKTLNEILIMIPPSINEQYAISRLIKAFDNLITLHQRKLEHLQLQKKALLQQMFV